ncbi:MAG: PAS domain S-box protein [Vicinamibacterales bacterium]
MTGGAEAGDSETSRQAAIRRYLPFDAWADPEFDELTQIAADAFAVPIAVVSLVDATRVWFRSRVGLDISDAPRAGTFCDVVVGDPDGLVVPDATLDPRFRSNPMVAGAPHVRFYAGCPLTTDDGHRIGVLAVLDRVPRSLTPAQWNALARLARVVMRQLELRASDRRTVMEAAFQRALFDSAGMAIVVTDATGLIIRLNPAAEQLLGWADAEVARRCSPLQFHDPEELRERAEELSRRMGRPLAPGAEYFRTVLSGGAADKSDWTFIRKDGGRITVQVTLSAIQDAAGHFIGCLGIIDDVTERRAALEEARRSEARFRALSVSAPVGIFQTDVQGRCIYTNGRWQELAGLSEADALGNGWARAIVDEDRDEIVRTWAECARTGAEFSREFRMHGQPLPRWVHARSRPIVSETGAIIGHVGTVEDVTDRRAVEEALREKEGLLREIHHRVKNNLQIISSLLRFQAKQLRDPRDLGTFAAARDRLRSMVLVHEMLYQSRELSRINLPDYLARLLRELSGPAETVPDSHDLRLDCVDVDLHADQALPLGMMVTELVTNALKYAYAPAQHGVVDVRAVRQGDRLVVSVVDDGRGIPGEADLQQPESFGWRLIRMLAGQLGADIAVRRSPGTRVDVSLPLKPAG